MPGPAPYQWNTGNGTAGSPIAEGITGLPVTDPVTSAAPPAPAASPVSSPSPSVTSAPDAGIGTGGTYSNTGAPQDNLGAGGLKFTPPPSGSASTSAGSATTQPTAGATPASSNAGSDTPSTSPVHYAGLSSTPIPGAAPMGAIALDDGGSVEPSANDDVTAAVNQAMDTVSSLFDFGRKKHGLGGGGGDAPMGGAWGQIPNTSGDVTTPGGAPIGGSKRAGEIEPTPLHDDASDKGYSSPTVTGLPAPQVQGAEGGGRISGIARGGAVKSYADGGSVDDDAGGPDVQDAAQGSQDTPAPGGAAGGQQGSAQGVPGSQQSPQQAIGYLTGHGAAPSQMVQALEQQVDPHGQMSPEIRKLLAVHAAAQQGGPEAGWAAMQHYRQRFLMLGGAAAAQLTGNQQKPANPAMAAKTATDAYSNSLTGNKVSFAPHPQGLVASVQPHKRPATPAMAGGGAIPSYDDGGDVDQDNTGLPAWLQGGPNIGTLASGEPSPSPPTQKPLQAASPEQEPSGEMGMLNPNQGTGSPAGGGEGNLMQDIGRGMNAIFRHGAPTKDQMLIPTDAAKAILTDAAGNDKDHELGTKNFWQQHIQNVAGTAKPAAGQAAPAGGEPAAAAPAAQEGAPAPTQPPAAKGGKAGKTGKTDTADEPDHAGKLITLPDGTKVYENLWKLSHTGDNAWASQQGKAKQEYLELLKEYQGGEQKVAAAELKGQGAANIAQLRANTQKDIATGHDTVNRESRSRSADIRQQVADQMLQKHIADAKARGDSNRARILTAALGNYTLLPPELQGAANARTLEALHQQDARGGQGGQGGEDQGQAPAAGGPNKAAAAAQGNMQELSKVGKPPTVQTQAQFDALPSGATYISTDGKPHRKP